jgi:hypothetical protein
MKVLIPFSGGINSTYGLWRWLSETDHEIHAYRHVEHFESEERKQVAARNMVQWLKDNVRDFNFWEEDGILEPSKREIILPIRSGFTNSSNLAGVLYPRWLKRTEVIDRIKPDVYLSGISLENTYWDYPFVRIEELRELYFSKREGLLHYFVGSKILDTPYPAAYFMDPVDPEKWINEKWDVIGSEFIGRFEQWELLPDELKVIRAPHHISRCDYTETFCLDCFWETVQEKRTDLTGREKDLALAELGSYGPFRGNADPETYLGYPREHINACISLLGDHLDWPEGISWT